MKIDILTIFPEMFESLKSSIIGKALNKDLFELNIIDFRDFTTDSHNKVDDYVFGGGSGMLIKCQPIYDAVKSIKTDKSWVIYLSPKGKTLTQDKVISLARGYEHLILICGHYEGIDERIIQLVVDEQISIGDYILTGGEIPAMVLVDAIARYIPSVLNNDESVDDESYVDGLLEYPQYTRPREFMGLKVPDVLINGNHKEIEQWKQEQKQIETKKYRPDLLNK